MGAKFGCSTRDEVGQVLWIHLIKLVSLSSQTFFGLLLGRYLPFWLSWQYVGQMTSFRRYDKLTNTPRSFSAVILLRVTPPRVYARHSVWLVDFAPLVIRTHLLALNSSWLSFVHSWRLSRSFWRHAGSCSSPMVLYSFVSSAKRIRVDCVSCGMQLT